MPIAAALDELEDRKVAVLVGAEGPGLAEHTMRELRCAGQDPDVPRYDSLNVATADGVGVLHDAPA